MDLKSNWNSTKFENMSGEKIARIMEGRRLTSLDKLKRRYRAFMILEFFMIINQINFVVLSRRSSVLFNDETTALLWSVGMGFFFLVAAIMDMWLYRGISKIDLMNMPIAKVSEMSYFYRKRHLQFVAVLLPMAFLLCGIIIYNSRGDLYMVATMILGVFVGLAIGIYQLMKFLSDYQSLTE